jgi:hypothetical protein
MCVRPDGTRVEGWIACNRAGEATYLNLRHKSGSKSGVLISLATFVTIALDLIKIEPGAPE